MGQKFVEFFLRQNIMQLVLTWKSKGLDFRSKTCFTK